MDEKFEIEQENQDISPNDLHNGNESHFKTYINSPTGGVSPVGQSSSSKR